MSNYDPEEIAKFNDNAALWWDPEGEFKSLHDINPLRMGFIQAAAVLKGKKVLDIGCGGGILSEALAKAGAVVTAIDLSPALIETAKIHAVAGQLDIDYHCCSAETLAQTQAANFDVITCLEMLEHVPEPRAIVQACAELVKPGGDVFFSTLNRNFKSYLLAIVVAEYILKLLPRGTHDYAKFIRPSELDEWAREHALPIVALRGMSYSLLTKRYFLTADVGVNYFAHCQKSA